MASGAYNKGKKGLWDGTYDLDGGTIKAMLVDNTYTFDPDNTQVANFNAKEISVTNYTGGAGGSGRKSMITRTITANNSIDKAVFTADPLTWTALGAGVTVGGLNIYWHASGSDDTLNIPLFWIEFSPTQPTNGNDFLYTPAAAGIVEY